MALTRADEPQLEQEHDAVREELAAERFRRLLESKGGTVLKFKVPGRACFDWTFTRDDRVICNAEFKVRKETKRQLKSYTTPAWGKGRLFLKGRKVAEMKALHRLVGTPNPAAPDDYVRCVIVFALENGTGEMYMLDPTRIPDDRPLLEPLKRRRPRPYAAASDDEPGYYLAWDDDPNPDLTRVLTAGTFLPDEAPNA